MITIATAAGTIHALEVALFPRTLCGRSDVGGIRLRNAPIADTYVTCKACEKRRASGIEISAATVRARRLRAQLSEPVAGADPMAGALQIRP